MSYGDKMFGTFKQTTGFVERSSPREKLAVS
jgi:hypothetical protein